MIGALALRLLGSMAGGLGVSLPLAAFLAGLAAADQHAEINTLTRERDEARADAATAAAARDLARADEARNAEARATAETERDEYASELAKRGPAGACGLNDADLARLQGNAWGRAPGGGRADPPARR
ncbi:hypothetical protein [Methylobacterium sp. CCH5-D2]|uniref:hypothetical protein n=1 Tax=Methylobacterium sp. CCH5-D2 TaxID=1768765 RepID=UPI0008324353|nr:hypothetical protein [Methylobacterium sp. CCH5-D2]